MISLITRGIYIYRWLIPIIGKEHSHQATSMQSLREEDGFEDKKRTVGWGHIECPRVPYSVVPHSKFAHSCSYRLVGWSTRMRAKELL